MRLQRALFGPAREAVKALLVLPQSVDAIMQTLFERFGRDEYIIKNLINKTRRIAAPTEDVPQTIVEFSTAVNNMVVTVMNLGRRDYLDNPQLLEDIELKLPPMLSMLWTNAMSGNGRYNITDLNHWLNQQSRSLSLRALPAKEKKTVHKVFATSETISSSSSLVEKRKTFECVLCKKQCESLAKCSDFSKMTVDERYQFAKKKFVCYCCLYYGHSSLRCRRRLKCSVEGCHGRHHTMLHNPRSTSTNQQDAVQQNIVPNERETCAAIPSAKKSVLGKRKSLPVHCWTPVQP